MAVLLLADVVEGKLATDQVAKTLTAVKSLGPVTVTSVRKRSASLMAMSHLPSSTAASLTNTGTEESL